MSSLRARIGLLAPAALILALVAADLTRAPADQQLAAAYVSGVRFYQRVGRPLLAGRVLCRFEPSCSEYSARAVERHGLLRGLQLTVDRLSRCTASTPAGTTDPVM